MANVIPSSTSSISFIAGCSYNTIKTNNGSIKCCSTTRAIHAKDYALPLSTSLRLFTHIKTFGSHHKRRFGVASATGLEVDASVEQADSGQDSGQTSKSTSTIDKSKQRSRSVRKSEMPPKKDEELVPGATFTGKVRSIQPFGAFVDFGAFTDGLVHVSQLSEGYVKDVSSVVSVGQEVKVKLVEANIETGRITLTMRENESSSSPPRPKNPDQKSNPKRDRDDGRKSTKFVKGQELEGTVKNLTRSGAFINLSDGEEGFLPASEEADEGFGSIMGGGSSLEIGQEVKVRVLRIARGQVTLTMKKNDNNDLDSKLQGKVFTATNPFLIAFRENKDIASLLDERENVEGENAKSSGEADKVKHVSDEIVNNEIVSREEQVEITEETSSISSSSEQADAAEENISKDEDAIKHVSDENGSIISEEQVEMPHVA